MQHVFPVYTQEKECHDCYKCVRQCPVKAIRVVNERAYIVPEVSRPMPAKAAASRSAR